MIGAFFCMKSVIFLSAVVCHARKKYVLYRRDFLNSLVFLRFGEISSWSRVKPESWSNTRSILCVSSLFKSSLHIRHIYIIYIAINQKLHQLHCFYHLRILRYRRYRNHTILLSATLLTRNLTVWQPFPTITLSGSVPITCKLYGFC